MVDNKGTPTDEVINLRNKGFTNSQIITKLRESYSHQQISDALNQADIKTGIDMPEPPTPSQPQEPSFDQLDFPAPDSFSQPNFSSYAPETSRPNMDRIEEVAESIIQEKWDDLITKIGDITAWRENVHREISSIKQELLRQEQRFENLQKALLSKVSDYNKSVTDVSTEMRALEKVFEKILEPLTYNVKELSKITKELKTKK